MRNSLLILWHFLFRVLEDSVATNLSGKHCFELQPSFLCTSLAANLSSSHTPCGIRIIARPYSLGQIQDFNFVYDSEVRFKKSYPSDNSPWKPIGLWDVEAPTFCRQSAHRWLWGGWPYAPAALYPQEDSWRSFLLEAESNPEPNSGWKG
jgi:hypothetical protein